MTRLRRPRGRRRSGRTPQATVRLEVNGHERQVTVEPLETLLHVLRDRLGLTGSKQGCGRGECGACTVRVGAATVLSCITLAARVDEPVVTIEGMAEQSVSLRRSLADHGGFQCGFCTPGQVMSAASYIDAGGAAEPREIRRAMSGNICRCTGYVGIVDAVAMTAARATGGPIQ